MDIVELVLALKLHGLWIVRLALTEVSNRERKISLVAEKSGSGATVSGIPFFNQIVPSALIILIFYQ